MRKKILTSAALVFSLFGNVAVAQVPQHGDISCNGFSGDCGVSPFAKPFGLPPAVRIYGGILEPNKCWEVYAKKLTRKQFTPVFIGDFGRPFKCYYDAIGDYSLHALAVPKYMVLTIIYAPPGTTGHSNSSVSYQTASTTGSSVSSSQTFTNSNSVSVGVSGQVLGNGASANATFDVSQSTTDTQTLEIRKTATRQINSQGPSTDGINHDYDAIFLALNPPIDVAIDPYTNPNSVRWGFTQDINKTIITYVYVGQLNGHMTISTGLHDLLVSAGITEADYPDILAHDVLAGSNPNFDPKRFVSPSPGQTLFTYNPPPTPNDPVLSTTFSVSTTTTSTSTTSTDDTYKVSLSLSADADFFDLAKVSMKDTTSWSWSNKSSQSSSSGSTQTASLTIGGPSYGYTGPVEVEVLYDNVYRTFAFRFLKLSDQQITLEGTLCDSAGEPLPGKSLILSQDGISHRSYTDGLGRFRFIDVAISSGEITTEMESVAVRAVIPALSSPGTWQFNVGPCAAKH